MALKERIVTLWRGWPRWLHWLAIAGLTGVISGLLYLSRTIQKTSAVSQTELATSAVVKESSTSVTSSTSSSQSSQKTLFWVEVKGAVQHPDVYKFTEPVRVKDLILRAGGLLAVADDRQLNLAAKLQDGQSIYVPQKGEVVDAAETGTGPSSEVPTTATSTTSQEQQIDLNHADLTQLQQISGIGPKKAADILAYREAHGGFKNVDELTEVSGIGEKTLAKIQDQVCVN
ncbi:MAG: helix-hairpin-helix domain-containing protein [Lactobacillaceae bacterium]|jgi:competence protein ComEA|nr:helix-hairpin-helix domain-containing protein [Lactobacillaceae bacterium]